MSGAYTVWRFVMTRWARALLSVFSVLVLAGCDAHSSLISPTPTSSPDSPRPVSMAISGTTLLSQPGDTSQLTATVTFSDQTSSDVPGEARWLGQDESAATVSSQGLITAVSYGISSVNASYRTVNVTATIRVAPASAFLLGGVVTVQGFPVGQARVEFSSRCGTHSTMTDPFFGLYTLP